MYAYGIDYNWRDSFSDTVPDPVELYLARISRGAELQDISNWQFYAGDLDRNASWSAGGDLEARKPVLHDDRRNNFSLRKIGIAPYTPTQPSNSKSANNLAMEGNAPGVTPICKTTHYGNGPYLNDAILSQSEDSWDGDGKAIDWWGYTWPVSYNMNKLVYTTGDMFPDGGWFADLKVQVRQDSAWVDVTGLAVSPPYPFNSTAGPNKTYTFTFDDTWGDGIRIIGTPGGSAKFTSVGELEVYYALTAYTDNFTSKSLDSAWTWSVPLSGPTYSLTNGVFRLAVPRTNVYDQWIDVDNAPKLYRTDMGDGDWVIETRLYLNSFVSGANFHTGLMVKFGPYDYYIWGNAYGNKLSLTRTAFPDLAAVNDYTSRTVYLRLRKVDSTYYADYKTSASDSWTNAGSETYSGVPQWVGLMTKTWSRNKMVSDFDYFTLAK